MTENVGKICLACEKPLKLSNYTKHNKRYCSSKKCQKARAKANMEHWKEKHADTWRQAANRYSSMSHKKRRALDKAAAKEAAIAEINGKDQQPQKNALLVGIASFISREKTADGLIAFLSKMEGRGRKFIASYLNG